MESHGSTTQVMLLGIDIRVIHGVGVIAEVFLNDMIFTFLSNFHPSLFSGGQTTLGHLGVVYYC